MNIPEKPVNSVPDKIINISGLKNFDLLHEILENIGSSVALLTPGRQIAYANSQFSSMIRNSDISALLGLRLGQTFDCIHLLDGAQCGETADCKVCGSNLALMAAADNVPATRECRILRKGTNEALDLEVTASKIRINGQLFFMLTVIDISHKKRRRSLERIFFHDILNGISSLLMAAELMNRTSSNLEFYITEIRKTLKRMLSDINSQRLLSSAEEGDLKTNKEPFSLGMLIEDLTGEFQTLTKERNCTFAITESFTVDFSTDYALLSRVLINAVKNAAEASMAEQQVTMSIKPDNEGNVIFAVHNKTYIPDEIRNQIFKRSFSTKGQDRGLGTYSIKMLTENYLQGQVWFSSSEQDGTTFYILVPPMCI